MSEDGFSSNKGTLSRKTGVLLGQRVIRNFALDYDSSTPIFFVGIIREYQPPSQPLRSLVHTKKRGKKLGKGLYRIHYLDNTKDDISPEEAYDGVKLFNSHRLTSVSYYGKSATEQFPKEIYSNPNNFWIRDVFFEEEEYRKCYPGFNFQRILMRLQADKDSERNDKKFDETVLTEFGLVPLESFIDNRMKRLPFPDFFLNQDGNLSKTETPIMGGKIHCTKQYFRRTRFGRVSKPSTQYIPLSFFTSCKKRKLDTESASQKSANVNNTNASAFLASETLSKAESSNFGFTFTTGRKFESKKRIEGKDWYLGGYWTREGVEESKNVLLSLLDDTDKDFNSIKLASEIAKYVCVINERKRINFMKNVNIPCNKSTIEERNGENPNHSIDVSANDSAVENKIMHLSLLDDTSKDFNSIKWANKIAKNICVFNERKRINSVKNVSISCNKLTIEESDRDNPNHCIDVSANDSAVKEVKVRKFQSNQLFEGKQYSLGNYWTREGVEESRKMFVTLLDGASNDADSTERVKQKVKKTCLSNEKKKKNSDKNVNIFGNKSTIEERNVENYDHSIDVSPNDSAVKEVKVREKFQSNQLFEGKQYCLGNYWTQEGVVESKEMFLSLLNVSNKDSKAIEWAKKSVKDICMMIDTKRLNSDKNVNIPCNIMMHGKMYHVGKFSTQKEVTEALILFQALLDGSNMDCKDIEWAKLTVNTVFKMINERKETRSNVNKAVIADVPSHETQVEDVAKLFQATATIDGKSHILGTYSTQEEMEETERLFHIFLDGSAMDSDAIEQAKEAILAKPKVGSFEAKKVVSGHFYILGRYSTREEARKIEAVFGEILSEALSNPTDEDIEQIASRARRSAEVVVLRSNLAKNVTFDRTICNNNLRKTTSVINQEKKVDLCDEVGKKTKQKKIPCEERKEKQQAESLFLKVNEHNKEDVEESTKKARRVVSARGKEKKAETNINFKLTNTNIDEPQILEKVFEKHPFQLPDNDGLKTHDCAMVNIPKTTEDNENFVQNECESLSMTYDRQPHSVTMKNNAEETKSESPQKIQESYSEQNI